MPDKVTLLTDSTQVKGAGAVQDTYTLVRKGMRKLLRALGYHLPGQRRGLSPQVRALVETYSASRRFNGFKASVSTEPNSELILDIADVPATGSDGAHLMPTIERVEAQAGVTVERAIADGAYGSGDNRAACANYPDHPIDLVAPVSQPHDPEVHKSVFQIDLEAQTATGPQGRTVTGKPRRDKQGRPILEFAFARPDCKVCPLFERCVRSKSKGRTVRTHAHEALLQQARPRQQTDEFKELYRVRGQVERKQAELASHGLRETRYLGDKKRQLQRLWLGAAVNLKRLFKLAQTRGVDLEGILAAMNPHQMEAAPA